MKMINYALLAALAICVNPNTRAQDNSDLKTEKWQCFSKRDFSMSEALVEPRIVEGSIGSVLVAGTVQLASFEIAGFNRRWDFGVVDGEGRFKYSFIIEPDGSGRYYDFSRSDDGTARPSQFFECEPR